MSALLAQVAEHIGAIVKPDQTMACPACGGDFGPTMPVSNIEACYVDYLPGAPLLAGVCLDCGYITQPAAWMTRGDWGPVDPELCGHNLPAGTCPVCTTARSTR